MCMYICSLSSTGVAAAAIFIYLLFRLRANIKKLKLHFSVIFCAEQIHITFHKLNHIYQILISVLHCIDASDTADWSW